MTKNVETFDPKQIAELLQNLEKQPADFPRVDRLISIRQMGDITGWARTTLLRAESQGHIPRRKKLPNGSTAYLASEVIAWMDALPKAPLPSIQPRGARYQ